MRPCNPRTGGRLAAWPRGVGGRWVSGRPSVSAGRAVSRPRKCLCPADRVGMWAAGPPAPARTPSGPLRPPRAASSRLLSPGRERPASAWRREVTPSPRSLTPSLSPLLSPPSPVPSSLLLPPLFSRLCPCLCLYCCLFLCSRSVS